MLREMGDRFKGFREKHKDLMPSQQVEMELLSESTPDSSFLILIVSSCAIATFGLLANSTAVIIGAMIIAPLMLPIRGLAFGALQGNPILVKRGVVSILVGTLLAMAMACCLGWLVGIRSFGSEVWARSEPTLLDLGVAIVAGGISGYAKVQPKISGSLAGTAIAVALMPPICVIGLGLSQANWELGWGATLLYVTNLLGIMLSCMLAFLLTGYASLRHARRPLIWATISTAILLLPLSISFGRLVRQAQFEATLRQILLNRTITFQQLDLMSTNINWQMTPPEVRLNVRAREPITPKQVGLLEDFVQREMGRSFKLIFVVGQVEEVRRDTPQFEPPSTQSY
ncbi:DUF389 domain-containing protein [Leptolyngbya ohadii]|uniref:DUF389 domain-containing protein n=1 Tax=Leptolyngbya ohadii TaxID=1962290 RepID=UPI000B59AA67|nr:DUF389 domain-containing protein [Leptolyngbya ohadii]